MIVAKAHLAAALLLAAGTCAGSPAAEVACGENALPAAGFVRVAGTGLVDENGKAFRIRGTTLGNWLNPEGYMFGFGRCESPYMMDEMFRQLVGPEEAAKFWTAFKDAYITEDGSIGHSADAEGIQHDQKYSFHSLYLKK